MRSGGSHSECRDSVTRDLYQGCRKEVNKIPKPSKILICKRDALMGSELPPRFPYHERGKINIRWLMRLCEGTTNHISLTMVQLPGEPCSPHPIRVRDNRESRLVNMWDSVTLLLHNYSPEPPCRPSINGSLLRRGFELGARYQRTPQKSISRGMNVLGPRN